MKVQLETLSQNPPQSFSMLFDPRLSDLFFWHFHPEYELVYIEAPQGTRHVGSHISTYYKSDLVLIGSNIPHLNFDYGLQTDYRKVVLHLKPSFVTDSLSNVPELARIQSLFQRAQQGIAFKGALKASIGARLFAIKSQAPFERYLQVLSVLEELAQATTYELLHPEPVESRYGAKEQERLQRIYAFVDQNYTRKIPLEEVAAHSYLTKEAFCRYFKKHTTYTFTEFLNRYRITHAKRELLSGRSSSETCFLSGFDSLSYFNRIFKKVTGETPSGFAKRNRGERLSKFKVEP